MSEEWHIQFPGFLLAHLCLIKSTNLYNDPNNKEMEASALGSDFLAGFFDGVLVLQMLTKKIIPYPYMEMLLTVSPA